MSPDPPLVKPIAAVLYRDDTLLEQCLARLEAAFSPVDCRGAAHRFDLTDYYAPEMGSGLCRVLVSFSALRAPPFLVDARHTAAATEDAFRLEEKRRVNVDVGYLDLYKVVLASWKGARPQAVSRSRRVGGYRAHLRQGPLSPAALELSGLPGRPLRCGAAGNAQALSAPTARRRAATRTGRTRESQKVCESLRITCI